MKERGTDLLYVTSITLTIEVTPLSFKDDFRVVDLTPLVVFLIEDHGLLHSSA